VHLQDEDGQTRGAMEYSEDEEDDMELPFTFERHSSPQNEGADVVMMEWINHSPDEDAAHAELEYHVSLTCVGNLIRFLVIPARRHLHSTHPSFARQLRPQD
jgi:hypothetical protein